jgi:hypothetical protein
LAAQTVLFESYRDADPSTADQNALWLVEQLPSSFGCEGEGRIGQWPAHLASGRATGPRGVRMSWPRQWSVRHDHDLASAYLIDLDLDAAGPHSRWCRKRGAR